MRVLLAEDEALSRYVTSTLLADWGYEVSLANDGREALSLLTKPDRPQLAVLDWMMPHLDGTQVVRAVRQRGGFLYVILLTAKGQREDVVSGLDAGADDYIIKPFNADELRSRVKAGERIVSLKGSLDQKVGELQAALDHVSQLQGLLPICMHCKRIRDDREVWHRLETYIEDHSTVLFSHSLCEDCLNEYYADTESED